MTEINLAEWEPASVPIALLPHLERVELARRPGCTKAVVQAGSVWMELDSPPRTLDVREQFRNAVAAVANPDLLVRPVPDDEG